MEIYFKIWLGQTPQGRLDGLDGRLEDKLEDRLEDKLVDRLEDMLEDMLEDRLEGNKQLDTPRACHTPSEVVGRQQLRLPWHPSFSS